MLLVLLLLKLSLELLFLHLMQDPKKVHCRVRGRGYAAGGWRPLCVVDRCCWPAGLLAAAAVASSAGPPLDGPDRGTPLGSPS